MSLNAIERKRKEELGVKPNDVIVLTVKSPNLDMSTLIMVVQWGMLFVTRENQKSLDSFSSHVVLQVS